MIDPKTGEKKRTRIMSLTLKELSAVDNPAQEGAMMAIMKRQEETMASIAKAQGDFNEAVQAIAKRDGCGQHLAMSKARQSHPALFAAAYSGRVIAVPPPSAMSPAPSAVAKAASDFNAKVSEIAARDRCGQHIAMTKARQEAPELFRQAYAR